jgi:hypothetical protein
MPIEASKSIWTCRCAASKHQNRFGHVDVRHRSIKIDLDMSMCGIEASKSIWTCRCVASKHQNRFGHVDVRHRSIEIDLDMSMWPIDASDAGTRVLEHSRRKIFRHANVFASCSLRLSHARRMRSGMAHFLNSRDLLTMTRQYKRRLVESVMPTTRKANGARTTSGATAADSTQFIAEPATLMPSSILVIAHPWWGISSPVKFSIIHTRTKDTFNSDPRIRPSGL